MTIGSVITFFAIAGAASLAVRSIYLDKKAGRSLCGGNCGSCHGSCSHK